MHHLPGNCKLILRWIAKISNQCGIQMRVQAHVLAGDGVGEGQTDSAKKLTGQAKSFGKINACVTAILGITQNRATYVRAVEPQLMGTPGDRSQCQLAVPLVPLQHMIFGHGGFALWIDFSQQTGQGKSDDGRVNGAGCGFRATKNQRMINLFYFAVLMELIHQRMNMGIFSK